MILYLGYEGDSCDEDIDECISNPCTSGSSCINEMNWYRCLCSYFYQGTNCENEIDFCSNNKC